MCFLFLTQSCCSWNRRVWDVVDDVFVGIFVSLWREKLMCLLGSELRKSVSVGGEVQLMWKIILFLLKEDVFILFLHILVWLTLYLLFLLVPHLFLLIKVWNRGVHVFVMRVGLGFGVLSLSFGEMKLAVLSVKVVLLLSHLPILSFVKNCFPLISSI